MHLLSPTSLLLFVPLGGMVILLYLLKMKRREHTVSSVMPWRDAAADIQANAPLQRLKKNLLLILQLLAVAALCAALAEPYLPVQGSAENRIVVVIDCSASMQSTDVPPCRFDQAVSKARNIVGRMGPGDSMLVIAAGAKARVVSSFTSDTNALNAALDDLRPSDTGCDMRQAMALAFSMAAGRRSSLPRIVVFSDGGFEPLSDLPAVRARIDFVRVGRRLDNVAITGLDSRATPAGDQQVFIGMRNFSDRERRFNLEIYLDDRLIDIREQSLAPGAAEQEIITDTGGAAGRVTAKLDVSDDLAVDNSGSVYLTRRRDISALLVGKGNIFLQNALNLDPRTRLTMSDAVPADFADSSYDLVALDNTDTAAPLPRGGFLLINSFVDGGPAAAGESVDSPTVIDWARSHPVTAYVDFAGVRIARARYLRLKPWASAIVEGEGGVLGAAGENAGRRFVQLSFNLLESDFPLRVGFPIFVANCLEYLVPQSETAAGESARTGHPVSIHVPPDVRRLTVTCPDGQKRELDVVQTPVVFVDTDRAGVYKVEGKCVKREFACNLASSAESGTAPRSSFKVGPTRVSTSAAAIRTNREYYWALLLAALAILTFEWYAYHRRL